MNLYIEEKFFSLWGKYNVFYEDQSVAYVVQGQPSLIRRKMTVMDPNGNELAQLQTKILTFLPAYTISKNGVEVGRVKRKFTLLKPKLEVDFKGWRVEGDILGWHFKVYDEQNNQAAAVDQKVWNITDHYVIDVTKPEDALDALLLTLSISAMNKDAAGAASASASSSSSN